MKCSSRRPACLPSRIARCSGNINRVLRERSITSSLSRPGSRYPDEVSSETHTSDVTSVDTSGFNVDLIAAVDEGNPKKGFWNVYFLFRIVEFACRAASRNSSVVIGARRVGPSR